MGSTDRNPAAIAALDVASDYLMSGDRQGSIALRNRSRAVSGAQASPTIRWHQTVWDAGLALLEGRLEDAEQLATDALAIGRRVGHPFARSCFNGQMALLDRERGRPDGILERLGHTVDNERHGSTGWTRAIVGRAALATGDLERAHMLFETLARERFGASDRNLWWSGTIVETAHLGAELEASDSIPMLDRLLTSISRQHGVLPIPILYGGPVSYARGALRARGGHADEAISLLEEAMTTTLRMGARPMRVHIALELAPLLVRGRASAGAPAILEQALDDATSIGMPSSVDRARELAARIAPR